jgi:hypothetical protein
MPRHFFAAWLSRACGICRAMARMSAIACSATARSLAPCALAARMPAARSASREYWSVPALIDWMKASRGRGNQLVPPQAGDQQHVHLRDARLQLLEAADFEPMEAGVAQGEASPMR